MKRLLGSGIFIIVMILIDLYVFQSLRLVTNTLPIKVKWTIYSIYWSITAIAVLLFFAIPYLGFEKIPSFIRNYVFAIILGLFIAKIVASIFFLVDDIRRIFQWGGTLAYAAVTGKNNSPSESISRSVFLSWLGLGLGGSLFATMWYGFNNKYRYQVRRVKMHFAHLPKAFKGVKIVQISDIHSGSLEDASAVEKGVHKILEMNPDLILFTGDLVNNEAREMHSLKHIFSKLTAPMGVYSILGNHDYGDYKQWASPQEKHENLELLKGIHAEMGWRLLLNEHVSLEKGGDEIALIGIENWGAKANFSRYGDLHKAYAGSEKYPFKILMSHDPSHWEAQVCKEYTDIDLMLAGHTHGMQFGVEIPGFKWSPVQYLYKQWAGVYEKGRQRLYVNRGFGFLGYPGRVGILPEITLIEFA